MVSSAPAVASARRALAPAIRADRKPGGSKRCDSPTSRSVERESSRRSPAATSISGFDGPHGRPGHTAAGLRQGQASADDLRRLLARLRQDVAERENGLSAGAGRAQRHDARQRKRTTCDTHDFPRMVVKRDRENAVLRHGPRRQQVGGRAERRPGRPTGGRSRAQSSRQAGADSRRTRGTAPRRTGARSGNGDTSAGNCRLRAARRRLVRDALLRNQQLEDTAGGCAEHARRAGPAKDGACRSSLYHQLASGRRRRNVAAQAR